MGKRIVVCCDGTWNTPDKTKSIVESGNKKIKVPCPTNVVKFALAVRSESDSDGKKQLTYYDPGIGTSGWFLERWFDAEVLKASRPVVSTPSAKYIAA